VPCGGFRPVALFPYCPTNTAPACPLCMSETARPVEPFSALYGWPWKDIALAVQSWRVPVLESRFRAVPGQSAGQGSPGGTGEPVRPTPAGEERVRFSARTAAGSAKTVIEAWRDPQLW